MTHDHHSHPHQDNDPHAAVGHAGHNERERRPAQWQRAHGRDGAGAAAAALPEPDLDLVEAAFADGFLIAADPTSFLRLAGIPFLASDAEGRTLQLLRVEQESVTDIGALSPTLGGGPPRYDPLPARLVARRRRLRFVYACGGALLSLPFEQARALGALPPG